MKALGLCFEDDSINLMILMSSNTTAIDALML
jgi:hypothetical protein